MTVKMPEPITAPMPEGGKRPRAERLLQRVFGLFRLADQLVDGFAGKQLAGQCSSPRPFRRKAVLVSVGNKGSLLIKRGAGKRLRCGGTVWMQELTSGPDSGVVLIRIKDEG